MEPAAPSSDRTPRWHLYRVLSDPLRLRLLALAAEDELAMGELADLLEEAQPNVSRHAAQLRLARLIRVRRQGTRSLARLFPGAELDPVVADALRVGRQLCLADGSLGRVDEVIRGRDARTREFFAASGEPAAGPPRVAGELPAYLVALVPVLGRKQLAVDAGTGDGALLDVLAPLFQRVVALDRSEAQLRLARRRVASRGYANVDLFRGEVDAARVVQAVGGAADVVVAARMLHHAARPRATVGALAALLRPGGRLVVVDYAAYEDEQLREKQADVWMGFQPSELVELAVACGLEEATVAAVPSGCTGTGPDSRVGWQALVAVKPDPRGRIRRRSARGRTVQRGSRASP